MNASGSFTVVRTVPPSTRWNDFGTSGERQKYIKYTNHYKCAIGLFEVDMLNCVRIGFDVL